MSRRTAVSAVLGAAFTQLTVFVILATLSVEELPLRINFGPESTFGIRPLEDVTGVGYLEFSPSIRWVNQVLSADEDLKRAWMERRPERVSLDDDTGHEAPSAPARPETWPFEGIIKWSARPVLALLTTGGVTLVERPVDVPNVVSLQPLHVELATTRRSYLILLAAGLIAGLVFLRITSSTLRLGLRNSIWLGFVSGCIGLMLTVCVSLGLARFGLPSLRPEWSSFFADLRTRGELPPFDLFSTDLKRLYLILSLAFLVPPAVTVALFRRSCQASHHQT